MELPNYLTKWLIENAFKFPNVVGFSNDFSIAQIGGKFDRTLDDVIRFYVTKKVDAMTLSPKQLIPSVLKIRHLLGKQHFKTDVIEIGEIKANPPIPLDVYTSVIDKTVNFRPVELGVSVGNQAITAGSLGMLYTVLENNPAYGVTKGEILAGSNAHVLTPDATWEIDEVINSGLINILQRGNYHGGVVPDDVVGKYLWHYPVVGLGVDSDCPVARSSVTFLNSISKILGRQSRFNVTVKQVLNTIDFSLYRPTVEHKLKIADNSILTSNKFGAHLFAGSETSGVLCHISEILSQCPIKIQPANANFEDFKVGDRIKGCSFWCNYETDVIDVNAVVNVSYGTIIAPFTKLVLTNNDGTIKGGWSGSGWFKA